MLQITEVGFNILVNLLFMNMPSWHNLLCMNMDRYSFT